MLHSVAVASLVAASSWVVGPAPRAMCVQPALVFRQHALIRMQEDAVEAAAPVAEVTADDSERMADFTEDLLDALAADDSPLSEMDADPVFVQDDDAAALDPMPSYTNYMSVEEARSKYKLHESDSGSSQVQIAVLTARIAYLTKHMQENKKDYASLRGLTAMVTRRRKLLEFLLKTDIPEFQRITGELGIRTNQLLKPKLSGARGRRS